MKMLIEKGGYSQYSIIYPPMSYPLQSLLFYIIHKISFRIQNLFLISTFEIIYSLFFCFIKCFLDSIQYSWHVELLVCFVPSNECPVLRFI